MHPFWWSELPRSAFHPNNPNCTDEDYLWDYFATWYLVYYSNSKMTLDDITKHRCFRFIQSSFQGQLKAIMTVMAYSLYDTGIGDRAVDIFFCLISLRLILSIIIEWGLLGELSCPCLESTKHQASIPRRQHKC